MSTLDENVKARAPGDPEDTFFTPTIDQKDDIVRQIVDIITQLQALVIPTPGPLDGGICKGHFFTEFGAGPFKSGSEMAGWFNHKLNICKHFNQAPKDIPPFEFTEFVLVHQDISPRNMILDVSGRVWLIDWADAGAYPRAFERAALLKQYRFPEFNKMVLSLIPKYDDEVRQLRSIGYGLINASFA